MLDSEKPVDPKDEKKLKTRGAGSGQYEDGHGKREKEDDNERKVLHGDDV